ncbi:hypothetical protein GCM10010975_26800 [Comamonas phosphati]|nr:hypothetical protein GCM10010975_26800 [Comamonas phosphati]
MKPATLPPAKPYSRRKNRRMRLQLLVLAILAWITVVVGAGSAAYIVITELHSSLQIVL